MTATANARSHVRHRGAAGETAFIISATIIGLGVLTFGVLAATWWV